MRLFDFNETLLWLSRFKRGRKFRVHVSGEMKSLSSIIIGSVTVIEHHRLITPIALVAIQIFDLSTMTGLTDGELLPDPAKEVGKPLHHDR
jgi:hypothetical protein